MARHQDSRPRHQQIAAEIRAQIMAGELPPGTQLPSTQQLVIQYATANATIQRALKLLKDEGFLESRVGIGVYVRDRQSFVVNVGAYFSPTAAGYSYHLLPPVSEENAALHIAAALKLAGNEKVILRRRLMSYNGSPVELSCSYYPSRIAADSLLARNVRIRGGAPRVLAELGYPQSTYTDRLSVRPPTTEEVELLDLPLDVPVIRQLRVIYAQDGTPVEASSLVKGGHLYELQYDQVTIRM